MDHDATLLLAGIATTSSCYNIHTMHKYSSSVRRATGQWRQHSASPCRLCVPIIRISSGAYAPSPQLLVDSATKTTQPTYCNVHVKTVRQLDQSDPMTYGMKHQAKWLLLSHVCFTGYRNLLAILPTHPSRQCGHCFFLSPTSFLALCVRPWWIFGMKHYRCVDNVSDRTSICVCPGKPAKQGQTFCMSPS